VWGGGVAIMFLKQILLGSFNMAPFINVLKQALSLPLQAQLKEVPLLNIRYVPDHIHKVEALVFVFIAP
jgi:hypothetical protein